jgi:hypothetical protein
MLVLVHIPLDGASLNHHPAYFAHHRIGYHA